MKETRVKSQGRPRLDPTARERVLGKVAEVARKAPPPPAREVLRAALDAETTPQGTEDLAELWDRLPQMPVNEAAMVRNLVITARREDPAHAAFDVLRARIVRALGEHGWSRIGITSPGPGCGKSFTAINLAITLSRYDNARTLLIEADLRRSGLSRYLGIKPETSTGAFLRGEVSAEHYLRRLGPNRLNIGRNLAIGLNAAPEPYAAELFQRPETAEVLGRLEADYQPDVLLYDLPPALAQDDVIALSPYFDCVLMVVGGGLTSAGQITEAQRRLGETMPILGIVMNKAEDQGSYTYNYG